MSRFNRVKPDDFVCALRSPPGQGPSSRLGVCYTAYCDEVGRLRCLPCYCSCQSKAATLLRLPIGVRLRRLFMRHVGENHNSLWCGESKIMTDICELISHHRRAASSKGAVSWSADSQLSTGLSAVLLLRLLPRRIGQFKTDCNCDVNIDPSGLFRHFQTIYRISLVCRGSTRKTLRRRSLANQFWLPRAERTRKPTLKNNSDFQIYVDLRFSWNFIQSART